MPGQSKRIIIAMSGGVDSASAAVLLIERGFDVVGVMMTLWSDPSTENLCCTTDSMDLARQVAETLSIPFHIIDIKQDFYQHVVQYFIDSYKQGETPNPCIACNRYVRWKSLFRIADELGCEFVATGHYARTKKTKTGHIQLLRGVDMGKDQSYVLHGLTQEQLSRTIFPLGNYKKPEIRAIARQSNLSIAERPDSQDLCFVGKSGYRDFLINFAPDVVNPGPIISTVGEILGQHQGLAFYTIGQRKGLGVSGPGPNYVIKKSVENNTIIIGSRDELGVDELTANQVNWIRGFAPEKTFRAAAKTRYKTRDVSCLVNPLKESCVHIKFDEPLPDITAGQSAVIYDGDICLGGGIIQ